MKGEVKPDDVDLMTAKLVPQSNFMPILGYNGWNVLFLPDLLKWGVSVRQYYATKIAHLGLFVIPRSAISRRDFCADTNHRPQRFLDN